MKLKNKNEKTKGFEQSKKAWVVAADMGYGHQRTAYPLRDIAFGEKIINANSYEGIPAKDKKIWSRTRYFYELISRMKNIPILGTTSFSVMDYFQKIMAYYPKRDMSYPTSAVKNIFHYIKKGWGTDLIDRLSKNSLPLVSAFFTPAFMAEEFGYKNDIYCIICDADIARAWVPLDPQNSKIKYFASNTWTRDRLKLYGVNPKNIILSGYPLPKENIGAKMEIIKDDMKNRLINLDPEGRYRKTYEPLIKWTLGNLPKNSDHPLTIMFSIGGAGAQKEIAIEAIKSLSGKIKSKKLKFLIAIGVREELREYFVENLKNLQLDGWVHIVSGTTTNEYFKTFNEALRETDVLWTKPSELSFYAGLGIPIIIAPTIGSQEDFNKRWLIHTGAGVSQENPKYTDQWFYDLLNGGDFAELAMQGFIEIEKMGAYNIEKIINR